MILLSLLNDNGQSFLTAYMFSQSPTAITVIVPGITSIICTILADSTMIWRCWIVWGQHWLSILPSVLFLLSAIGDILTNYEEYIISDVLYSSFILATTLWCTVLIIYRIITVVQAGSQAAFFSYNSVKEEYFDYLAAVARGIAPTLLVGRVAAGHTCPDDSWQGSVISGSLQFGTHSGGQSSQQDSMISIDLESQQEIGHEYGHQNPASSGEDRVYDSGIQEDDLEVAQQEGEITYSYRTLAESQTDVGINSEDVTQEHGPELEQERER
ncbi:uncharacterized protein BT62DRAFT_923438 [Guyanagaster necrorhizus]|uniref:Uncharacterized protein n=1 Tax=Guyanagaster necrorhizus TaxID=856835 RepID=A0A9P7VIY5_9AGAR|nr:uncharacterized protein BT62DRAFT_923438 [Guyanagaster necrorhizus MCA 3950]KAG7441210.1 hypothetical protein BT62DRAFT_923438 [Guyanagaster necrorhizus MCA 3950]